MQPTGIEAPIIRKTQTST